MKGLSEFIATKIGDDRIIDVEELTTCAMKDKAIKEKNKDIDHVYRSFHSDVISTVNALDFYSIGKGKYAALEAMSMEQIMRVKNRLQKVIQSMRKTVKKFDGQITMIANDAGNLEINIPDPIVLNVENGDNETEA